MGSGPVKLRTKGKRKSGGNFVAILSGGIV